MIRLLIELNLKDEDDQEYVDLDSIEIEVHENGLEYNRTIAKISTAKELLHLLPQQHVKKYKVQHGTVLLIYKHALMNQLHLVAEILPYHFE